MVKYLSFFGTEALIIRSLNATSDVPPYCLFCADNEEIDKQEKILKFISPKLKVLKFPAWDCKPYDVISPSRKVVYERLKCLSEIKNAEVIITTYESLVQKVIPKEIIESGLVLSFKRGQEFEFEAAIRRLSQIGFHRMMNAIEVGEFAVRGSIIDVVSEEGGIGYRLDFFGNRLETIRSYDVVNQNTLGKVEEIFITPMSEINITEESKKRFKSGYKEHFGVGNDILEESVAAGKLHNGIEHYLPLFYDHLSSFADYLPKNTKLLLKHDYGHQIDELYDEVVEKFNNRENLKDSIIKPLDVGLLYDVEPQSIGSLKKILLSPFERENNIFQKSPYENLFLRAKQENQYSLEFFKSELQKHNTHKVLFCCYTASSLERMQKLLLEYELPSVIAHSIDEIKSKYSVTILPIERGYIYNDITFISELELLGHIPSKDKRSRKKTKDIFNELLSINIGELVVHVDLGIGRFEGLEQIKVAGTVHDFIRLKYAGGDKFYLPVENLDLLTKYGVGDDAVLDKLGAVGWQSRKAKLKERIKESAEKLLKLAAQRSSSMVTPIVPKKEFYDEFVHKFQYVETEDQLNSIDAVLKDIADTKPMDRLICGDVGFGKTEVALRAAAAIVSAQSTAQVAILVPTTLLARQHFKTFCERFSGFNTKIGQLSKFSPRNSIKATKEALANGSMNIVVGTHMLLSQSIKFKNLKLLIIDEEQHFGVAQKEKLKELKNDCHVLTLSATPIPRTLQMSLFGIKDLSLIATPPVNRLPIVTHVIPFDILTVREAILREHYRGGRTFIVTPRVAFLDGLVDLIKEHIPEVKVRKAHGGMNSEKLDEIMNEFYDGRYEVLISTSIVESGLDIPFANTIIIDRADMFGLAQLYQIRGRVGRSNVQAYAYLTYSPNIPLTINAEKRLEVIASFEDLGAGFSVASNDMDIRGYGNLLGDEQSGHVKEVGIELYQQMLQEAIEALKSSEEAEISDSWSPSINIGISIQIPQSYISEEELRINLYRKIASLKNEEEISEFKEEMIDRYGVFPNEVGQLFDVISLKLLAKQAWIEKIELGEKALLITFKDNSPLKHEAILEFVSANHDQVVLRPGNKLLINKLFSNKSELIAKLVKVITNFI